MKKLISLLLVLWLLTGCMAAAPTQTTTFPEDSGTLTVHFLDVGQADCILLEYDGQFMLIDGGNVADSSLVVSYLEKQGVTRLEAVVCTHPHEDHAGGLPAVLAVFETAAVYAPTRTYSSNCFDDLVYYTDQQGLQITIPEPGDVIRLGDATATVMGPVQSYADPNDTSIVLLVEFGNTRFLFTGDMETQAENDMLDYWGEGYDWKIDVLKVGHHGSDTSTGYRLLYETMPTYGVISVGRDNSYGHPHERPMSLLHDAGVILYRTDEMGSIVIISDGTTLTFHTESGSPQIPDGTQGQTMVYIGNIHSKKLHVEGCPSLPKEENRTYFDSYEAAIAAGYVPCKSCMD